MNTLLALIRKDLVLYFSDRRALLMSIAAPIVIAAFFGSLFDSGNKKPMRIPVAIVNQDDGAVMQKILARLKSDAAFDIRESPESSALLDVKQGKVHAAIVFPKDFGTQAARALFTPGNKPTLTIHYDPSRPAVLPMVRGLIMQHAMQAVSEAAFSLDSPFSTKMFDEWRNEVQHATDLPGDRKRDLMDMFDSIRRVQAAPATASTTASAGPHFDIPFATREAAVTSGKDRQYNSYAHAFAGMGVQFILFMGIDLGVGVLLARRMGLWKRLRAAPLSRTMLLGSRIASGALTATVLMAIIFAAAILAFGVRIEGSLTGFIGVVLAFSIMTASFGLLIAAIGKTPEATRGLAIFVTLILVMLGGAWVPTFVFPEWLQTVSLVVPTRWAVDGLDAMTWRGLPLIDALAPISAMLGFSALFAALAVWRFHWEE